MDRFKKGKYSAHNSGNYFSLFYQGRYSQTGDYLGNQLVNQAGVLWGFQRNFPGGFSFDFNFGLVHSFVSNYVQYYDRVQIATNLRLGYSCLLYTSDAADERSSVDLGGRRTIQKKNKKKHKTHKGH